MHPEMDEDTAWPAQDVRSTEKIQPSRIPSTSDFGSYRRATRNTAGRNLRRRRISIPSHRKSTGCAENRRGTRGPCGAFITSHFSTSYHRVGTILRASCSTESPTTANAARTRTPEKTVSRRSGSRRNIPGYSWRRTVS